MSEKDLKDLYFYWQRKTLSRGYSLNQFREHFSIFVSPNSSDKEDIALGAKLAYKSLTEIKQIHHQMENAKWI